MMNVRQTLAKNMYTVNDVKYDRVSLWCAPREDIAIFQGDASYIDIS